MNFLPVSERWALMKLLGWLLSSVREKKFGDISNFNLSPTPKQMFKEFVQPGLYILTLIFYFDYYYKIYFWFKEHIEIVGYNYRF